MILDSNGDILGTMPGYVPASDWLKWAQDLNISGSKILKWRSEIKDKPEDGLVYRRIGDEYQFLKNDPRAVEAYSKAIEANDKRDTSDEAKTFKGEVLFSKALSIYRGGDPIEKLKEIYKAILELDPDGKLGVKDNGLLVRALYGEKGGEGVDVLATVDSALSKFPNSDCLDGLLFVKGHATWKTLDDKEGGIKILQDASSKYPLSFFKPLIDAALDEMTGKKKPKAK